VLLKLKASEGDKKVYIFGDNGGELVKKPITIELTMKEALSKSRKKTIFW
jgi:hypothetical protein